MSNAPGRATLTPALSQGERGTDPQDSTQEL
jgi:hypothetical protein